MAQRPDMQRHHQRRRAGLRRCTGASRFASAADDRKRGIRSTPQRRVGFALDPVEHRRIGGRIPSCEGEVSAATPLDRSGRVGAAIIPGSEQVVGQPLEPLPGKLGHQGAAVAKMAVGSGWADPRSPRQLGKGEPAQTTLGNQPPGSLNERLAQVAVMVAVAGKGHVKTVYITKPGCDSPPFPALLL